MESNEKFRGQTDGIILFILSKGERHADELKIIIDELRKYAILLTVLCEK